MKISTIHLYENGLVIDDAVPVNILLDLMKICKSRGFDTMEMALAAYKKKAFIISRKSKIDEFLKELHGRG